MITQTEQRKYLTLVGSGGSKALVIIRQLEPYIEALSLPFGKELLEENIEKHLTLTNKIYNSIMKNGSAEQSDVIELKVREEFLKEVYNKLKLYYVNEKLIKDTVKNN